MNQAQNQSRNLAPLLIILAVLIIAVAGYRAGQGGWPTNLAFWEKEKLTLVETAQAGQMVKGFPVGLVSLVEDARVVGSQIFSGGEGEEGRTVLRATYETKAGIPTLFAAYVDYFTDKGYLIVSSESKRGITTVYAKNEREEVHMSMFVTSSLTTEVQIDVSRPVIQ